MVSNVCSEVATTGYANMSMISTEELDKAGLNIKIKRFSGLFILYTMCSSALGRDLMFVLDCLLLVPQICKSFGKMSLYLLIFQRQDVADVPLI